MAKCVICGKGPMTGNNVAHSKLKTKRVWQPNIQRVKANINGKIRKINVCVKCIKSGKIQKVI